MLSRDDPFPLIRLLIDGCGIAASIAFAIFGWLRLQSARHWPITYGTVEIVIPCDLSDSWFADISYSYKVDTHYYSGQYRLKAKNENDAESQASMWRGQNLVVRYLPKKPEISVMRMEDQPTPLTHSIAAYNRS